MVGYTEKEKTLIEVAFGIFIQSVAKVMDSEQIGLIFCNITLHITYTTNDFSHKPLCRRNTVGGLKGSMVNAHL